MREEKMRGKGVEIKTKMLRLFFLLDYSLRRLNY